MDKIYKVQATFEDFEFTTSITIGVYNDEKLAKDTVDKWKHFFSSQKSIFQEPPNWNPKDDDWYDEDDNFSTEWKESAQYHSLLSKYDHLRSFSSISITEYELNTELFIDSFKHYDSMGKLMKEFNREWNLNKIISDGGN